MFSHCRQVFLMKINKVEIVNLFKCCIHMMTLYLRTCLLCLHGGELNLQCWLNEWRCRRTVKLKVKEKWILRILHWLSFGGKLKWKEGDWLGRLRDVGGDTVTRCPLAAASLPSCSSISPNEWRQCRRLCSSPAWFFQTDFLFPLIICNGGWYDMWN